MPTVTLPDSDGVQEMCDESGEKHVEGRVLLAADVEVNRHTLGRPFLGNKLIFIFVVQVAQKVPRRVHEGVHGVRLPHCFHFSAFGTFCLEPLFGLGKRWFPFGRESLQGWQLNGKVPFIHRHCPTPQRALTVDHRDGSPPVPLSIQVWPLTQFFLFPFCKRNHWFAWRANQWPLIREILFSSVPPSNSLVSVLDPRRAFWADTAPFKSPRLALCVAPGTTEKQEYRQVCCTRRGGPSTLSKTSDANLKCRFAFKVSL